MEALQEINKMSRDIAIVDRLGGRDSFFGLKQIFEIILKEKHDEQTEEEMAESYPFGRYRGMECYGNIVSQKYTNLAVEHCINELNFTEEEFTTLCNWYGGRMSPDTLVTNLFIQWYYKDNLKVELNVNKSCVEK